MKPVTIEQLDEIASVQHHMNLQDFRRIFGDSLGDHLWDSFVKRDGNLLKFFMFLDFENVKKLRDEINRRIEEKMKTTKKTVEMHAKTPSPEVLRDLIVTYGFDLMSWPRRYRLWLANDSDAAKYVSEEVPGVYDMLEDSVAQYHQENLFAWQKEREKGEDIPF